VPDLRSLVSIEDLGRGLSVAMFVGRAAAVDMPLDRWSMEPPWYVDGTPGTSLEQRPRGVALEAPSAGGGGGIGRR
jgi:hypothetical protein